MWTRSDTSYLIHSALATRQVGSCSSVRKNMIWKLSLGKKHTKVIFYLDWYVCTWNVSKKLKSLKISIKVTNLLCAVQPKLGPELPIWHNFFIVKFQFCTRITKIHLCNRGIHDQLKQKLFLKITGIHSEFLNKKAINWQRIQRHLVCLHIKIARLFNCFLRPVPFNILRNREFIIIYCYLL